MLFSAAINCIMLTGIGSRQFYLLLDEVSLAGLQVSDCRRSWIIWRPEGVVAKKGRHEAVDRTGESSATSLSVSVLGSDQQETRSGLNGAAVSGIGMGLVLQGGRAEARFAEGDATMGPGEMVGIDEHPAITVGDSEAAPESIDLQVMAQAVAGETLKETEVEPPVEVAELEPAGVVAASGRTSEIDVAGLAAASAAATLAKSETEEPSNLRVQAPRVHVEIEFEGEGAGLMGSVLDPVLGGGVVDNLLDTVAGEGGILDSLLGEGSVVDELIGAIVGENGLPGLDVLEGLVGDDGYLGGVINVVLGDEGLVAEVLGEEGVVDDLLESLVGGGGLLGGVLGSEPSDSVLGEGGAVLGVLEDLIGDEGLVGEVFGVVPVVSDLLGAEEMFGSVLGGDSALGGLLGMGGDDVAHARDGDTGSSTTGLLGALTGNGVLLGSLVGVDAEGGGTERNAAASGVGDSGIAESTSAADRASDASDANGTDPDLTGPHPAMVLGSTDDSDIQEDLAREPGDDGFLDTLVGVGAGNDVAADLSENLTQIGGAIFPDEMCDVLTGLLGDDDTFGAEVPSGEIDGFDDLFAGLVGDNSLTGALVGRGGNLLADDEVDDLLSEILGPSSADVTGGEGDVIGVLLGDTDADESTAQVGGLLAGIGGLFGDAALGIDVENTLLEELFSTQDDSL